MRRRSRRSSRATLWGLAGAALLAAGCFAPVAASIGGVPITLLSTGSILARLILVAALGSVALLLLGRRRLLLVTGTIAGLMVLAELVAFQSLLAVVSGSNVSAEAVLRSVSYEWGWALLVIGVGLLLLSGLVPVRLRRPSKASG